MLRDYQRANPGVQGVMMASHGIICWADSAKECYEHTVQLIADAANYLNAKMAGKPAFGGQVVAPNPDRAAIAADLMPRLRGFMTGARRKLGHYSDDAEALEFVGLGQVRRTGRARHLVPRPLPAHQDRAADARPGPFQDDAYLAKRLPITAISMRLLRALQARQQPAMRDPNPVVVLVPGGPHHLCHRQDDRAPGR
jgi:rhamnose utilization protein RhaD (predicted bifunctional aldolase and dehydrogenase)